MIVAASSRVHALVVVVARVAQSPCGLFPGASSRSVLGAIGHACLVAERGTLPVERAWSYGRLA